MTSLLEGFIWRLHKETGRRCLFPADTPPFPSSPTVMERWGGCGGGSSSLNNGCHPLLSVETLSTLLFKSFPLPLYQDIFLPFASPRRRNRASCFIARATPHLPPPHPHQKWLTAAFRCQFITSEPRQEEESVMKCPITTGASVRLGSRCARSDLGDPLPPCCHGDADATGSFPARCRRSRVNKALEGKSKRRENRSGSGLFLFVWCFFFFFRWKYEEEKVLNFQATLPLPLRKLGDLHRKPPPLSCRGRPHRRHVWLQHWLCLMLGCAWRRQVWWRDVLQPLIPLLPPPLLLLLF